MGSLLAELLRMNMLILNLISVTLSEAEGQKKTAPCDAVFYSDY
jgi:hypothetical protein